MIFEMNKIILVISLLFISTPSFAETYEEEIIYKDGAWKVAIWEFDDGSTSCATGYIEDEKEFFIEINAEEEYSIFGFWYDDTTLNSKLKILRFSIDENESWYTTTPTIEDGSIFFYFEDSDQNKLDKIIQQIKTGNKIFHWSDDNQLINEFDLFGAVSSIDILKKCVKNLE